MIISQTPLRISLCGGGTDLADYYRLKGGYVVSTAIDKYIFVIVKERFDNKIYVDYSQKEVVDCIDEIKHDLVREAAKISGMKNGFEIVMLADIPSEGSGLGSSSSLIVGLLNAFYSYQGIQATAEQLAREACEIEIDILKRPIGKQDQYIAAYGGLHGFRFNPDESVSVQKIMMKEDLKRRLGANLLLYFTNITRSASTILHEQKSTMQSKLDHHDKIKELAFEAETALLDGQIDKIGVLLSENWMLKKNLASNISNNEIEKMYERAIKGGAVGGKIAGAGGGGFLMLYCTRDKQDLLREAMSQYREMPFMLEAHGSKIIFNYRRYNWK